MTSTAGACTVGLPNNNRYRDNTIRLHSAIGYITPFDFMAGRSAEIWAARDVKLEAAREARRLRRSGEAA